MSAHLLVIPDELVHSLNPQINNRAPRFLRLPHPRTGLNALFLPVLSGDVTQEDRLLEVQAVDPDARRSWMFNNTVSSSGRLLMATPIDPAYILAALLLRHRQQGKPAYLEPDSLLDALASNTGLVSPEHELDFRYFVSLNFVVNCLSRTCDTKTIPSAGIITYCYSEERWIRYLQKKVAGLDQFISTEHFSVIERELGRDGILDDSKDLLTLGRLKLACGIVSHYLPKESCASLLEKYDFTRLVEYLQRHREEAAQLASKAPEKFRTDGAKVTKRKAMSQISHGVDKLKKVNTAGMAKLSNFFQKPTNKGQMTH